MTELVSYRGFRKQIYRLPTDVTLVTCSKRKQFIPEEEITRLALHNKGIVFTDREYSYTETHFGDIPNLVLKTQVFTRYQLLEPLCEIEYERLPIEISSKSKTLVLNFASAMNKVLLYYKSRNSLLFNQNYLKEKDVQKEFIEQMSFLSLILDERAQTFDLSGSEKSVALIDIVVFCFVKAILTNIPNSHPDYLLRTTYSNILAWFLQRGNIAEEVELQRSRTTQMFVQNAAEEVYCNDLDSSINTNGVKFGVSLAVAALIYGFFA